MVRSNIFGTELQSEGAGPYGPVFLNNLQKRPRSGPDRTVASLNTDSINTSIDASGILDNPE